MPYVSTKTYGHDIGLSCTFRQWRAESHCKYLHGYAISVRLEFEADELDVRNWVVDFGSLKSFKQWLETTFDHKLLVAQDDPQRERLVALGSNLIEDCGLEGACPPVAQVIILENVGCEAFAEYVYNCADIWLGDNGYKPRVRMAEVEVCEHGANSAIYRG